jgi:acyl dehydratase
LNTPAAENLSFRATIAAFPLHWHPAFFETSGFFTPGVPGFSVKTWTLKYDLSLSFPYFLSADTLH